MSKYQAGDILCHQQKDGQKDYYIIFNVIGSDYHLLKISEENKTGTSPIGFIDDNPDVYIG